MSITALAIIRAAFEELNVFQPSETVPGPDAQSAFGWLNRMVGSWAQQTFTIPAIAREVFPLVSGKGSPSNPYTVGVGGDLNIAKPPNQDSLVGAGLLLNASVPPVEIPRGIATDDGYNAIQIKDLSNTLFTNVYYKPTFAGGFGRLFLWPVPDNTVNSLVLYLKQALSRFATLTTAYEFPDAYEDAFVYNLARRLAKPWGATVDEDLAMMADNSLKLIKRSNLHLSDLPNDFVFHGRRELYNIQTGTGG